MKIVIIGAGNLATHLALALQNAGFELIQVYSRSEAPAAALAGLLQTRYVTDIAGLSLEASLYIIAVNDDSVPPLIDRLPLAGQLVVHTAGSIPMDVFYGKLQNYGVIYPLQTFSKSRPVDFTEIPVFLEANTPENLQVIRNVAGTLSKKIYDADSAERMYVHMAAVFGCNFVNYLYDLSAQIVNRAGFGFEILSPLLLETAGKAIASGDPKKVQTGPAVRNDCNVMQKHLALLAGFPRWKEVYALLSKRIGEKD
jgi:predicted short-subunit dehydrogenase-like oxidoreductase (DUF2520 family)